MLEDIKTYSNEISSIYIKNGNFLEYVVSSLNDCLTI